MAGKNISSTTMDVMQEDSLPVETSPASVPAPPSLIGLFHTDERSITFIGKPITALAKVRTKGQLNPITKDSVAIDNGVTIRLLSNNKRNKDGNVVIQLPGVGEAKLLRYGVSAFTKVNARYEKKPTLRIYGDTKAFARDCIKDPARGIDPRKMATPEEQEKENQRASKALENFVAKLGRNARMLKNETQFDIIATYGEKEKRYSGLTMLGAYAIDSDVIMLEFTQSAAEYFVRQPLSETPRALYAIDDRQTTAYAIADALTQHYGVENNIIKNTERILKVETLLRCTSLPSMDECREKRLGWEHFVKEPFEKAMDTLYAKGLIAEEKFDEDTHRRISGGWRYTLSGMEELTDEQATNITRYEQFASLYVCFELSGYEPHSDRIRTISEKREEKTVPKKKKKQKKASQNA